MRFWSGVVISVLRPPDATEFVGRPIPPARGRGGASAPAAGRTGRAGTASGRAAREASAGARSFAAIVAALTCLAAEAALADPAEIRAGRLLVEGQGLPKDMACADCHGVSGQGNRSPVHPRLAGQSRFYLRKQLDDFASGARPSDDMAPIARALTEEQREEVAAYYAAVEDVPYPSQPEADPALLQNGGVLSAVGAPGRRIRACETCHADAGTGIPPSYPYLAGQFAEYTERQLRLWKDGRRRNDPLNVMADIAKELSDEEIRALALYFARVRVPQDVINDLTPAEPAP